MTGAVLATIASSGVLASIPSPSQGVWHLGPVPLRAYAFCILAGIALAVWLTDRRWRARGGLPGQIADIALWAVPFGIVGGRLYHVVSSPDAYFGPGGDPVAALYIWNGGLGIWGAVALGAVGAWIGCRQVGARFSSYADTLAPGLLLAQAVGRVGNYFNQELYGRPTTLPWALEISPQHREPGFEDVATYHPTFLYELLWDAAAAGVLIWLQRRFRLGHGRVFFGYVVLYTLGRVWIEALRIDPAEQVLGLRLNIWTCLVVGLAGVVAFVVSARRHPGVEDSVLVPARSAAYRDAQADTTADDDGDARDDETTVAGAPVRVAGRASGGGAATEPPEGAPRGGESGGRDAASRDVR
ncbi:prolipoprotein diacylglyceryl transferase [Quadrisphaera oryzae]|uniref:prolipoprotein diacylglyceryl transferase n=1 Tax=Quadrisphaera TaxID=317661 RepID=UPI0016491D0B|nr:prolipoprotein diacylglyceryl transferase [Quadrisphaera sp. RL12-1S]MBC3762087.1 prolipoprotein diacylglyceryl transferase [Quadrisphaera sp. RL12-1S]